MAWPGLAQEAQSPSKSAPQTEQTQAEDAEPGQAPPQPLAEEKQPPTTAQQAPRNNPDYYPKADLAAQQRMAVGTEELVRLTDRQNIITSIEAGLLVLAIFFSAWASIAASRAARAADKAVEITSNTAERQLRAYVGPVKTDMLFRKDRYIETIIRMENAGHTPAREVSVAARQKLMLTNARNDFPNPTRNEPVSGATIGPGSAATIHTVMPDPLTDIHISSIENGKAVIYLWGTISYKDIFGKAQTNSFRYQFSGDKIQRTNAMTYCDEGNDAT